MNRRKLKNEMEVAWELRPQTDFTPQTDAHANRFRTAPRSKTPEGTAQDASSQNTERERS